MVFIIGQKRQVSDGINIEMKYENSISFDQIKFPNSYQTLQVCAPAFY